MNEELLDITKEVITYNKAIDITKGANNFDFIIDKTPFGDTITFNYRLNIYKSFLDRGARNLRGCVFNYDTKELLALPFFKFFNIDENPFTQYDMVKNWKIKSIYEKIDGSLIYFYKLNGHLLCRTKRSMNNIQVERANAIVANNKQLYDFIHQLVDAKYTPMFELVSLFDAHVVKYSFEDLCFLGARNNITGKIVMSNIDLLADNNNILSILPLADTFNTIDEIIEECNNDATINREDVLEGYTVLFDNGEIVKFKRRKYFEWFRFHYDTFNETELVKMILDNKIDDVMTEFKGDANILKYVNNMANCVDNTFNKWIKEANEFYILNKDNFNNKKDYVFAVKERFNNPLIFSVCMENWDYSGNPNIEHVKNGYIKAKMWKNASMYSPEVNNKIRTLP